MTIQVYNEHIKPVLVMEHTQNVNYYESGGELQQQQQLNYFLICECCFWMASTLSYFNLTSISPTIYKECPICKNKIDRFSIPPQLN